MNNRASELTKPIWSLTLGDRIRKARQRAGLEIGDLAEQVGVDRKTIGRWERDLAEPRVSDAARIALVTGVEFIDLCAPWELNPQPADYGSGQAMVINLTEFDASFADLDDEYVAPTKRAA